MLLFLASLVFLINHYSIDKTLTADDRQYIQLLMPGLVEGSASRMSYKEQVALVQRSQQAIQACAPVFRGIPEGLPRQPKDLYLGREGLCYDRSWVLEKIFMYAGLKTRHVSLFQREEGVHPLVTLLSHHVPSHAVSEVHTSRGWMLVDSNAPWIGLDKQKNPISIHQMVARYDRAQPIRWLRPVLPEDEIFYGRSSIYVYGLYSRHGRFFPPYTKYIPDYRVRGLLYNFELVRNR